MLGLSKSWWWLKIIMKKKSYSWEQKLRLHIAPYQQAQCLGSSITLHSFLFFKHLPGFFPIKGTILLPFPWCCFSPFWQCHCLSHQEHRCGFLSLLSKELNIVLSKWMDYSSFSKFKSACIRLLMLIFNEPASIALVNKAIYPSTTS